MGVACPQEELCGRWALTRVAKYLRCYWHCWPLAMDDRRWVAAEERAAWAAVQRSAVLSAAGAARAEAERLERRGRVSLSKAHAHGLRMRALAALETEEVEARARVAAAQRLQWHPLALRCVETAALDVRLETERAEERHRDDINGDLERVVCGNINFSSSQVVEISRNLSLSGSDLRTDADVDGVLAAILTGDVPRLRGILRARGSLINKPLNTGVGLLTPLMLAASCFQVRVGGRGEGVRTREARQPRTAAGYRAAAAHQTSLGTRELPAVAGGLRLVGGHAARSRCITGFEWSELRVRGLCVPCPPVPCPLLGNGGVDSSPGFGNKQSNKAKPSQALGCPRRRAGRDPLWFAGTWRSPGCSTPLPPPPQCIRAAGKAGQRESQTPLHHRSVVVARAV